VVQVEYANQSYELMKKQPLKTQCRLCDCLLSRGRGVYALPTPAGRSHGTRHHYVAERFFGRTTNRRTHEANPIFTKGDYSDCAGKTEIFCYECHEELLHNPIFLPADIEKFAKLTKKRHYDEAGQVKTEKREKIGQRIKLLNEVVSKGLDELLKS